MIIARCPTPAPVHQQVLPRAPQRQPEIGAAAPRAGPSHWTGTACALLDRNKED